MNKLHVFITHDVPRLELTCMADVVSETSLCELNYLFSEMFACTNLEHISVFPYSDYCKENLSEYNNLICYGKTDSEYLDICCTVYKEIEMLSNLGSVVMVTPYYNTAPNSSMIKFGAVYKW